MSGHETATNEHGSHSEPRPRLRRMPRSSSRWIMAVALVIGLLATTTTLIQPTASHAQDGTAQANTMQRGVNFVAYWPGVYRTPAAQQRLERMADTGADWVSILVFNFQNDLNATTIGPTEGTETNDDLRAIIGHAHDLGLKVMLRPMVDVAGQCRCRIGQGFSSETEWETWFASYRNMLYPYATLAAETNVEQFSVGAELEQTTVRESQWRDVIAGVRDRYDGPITYGAQHSGPELTITWWDAVDFIGIDAYYRIAYSADPTADELAAGWAKIATRLQALSEAWDRPILFTEAGYSNIDGTARTPWARTNGRPKDDVEQAMAFQAMFDAVWDQPWFAGVHLWEWFADPSIPGGVCNIGHVYIDKPAENVVRSFFGAEPLVTLTVSTNPADRKAIFTDELTPEWFDGSWNLNAPADPAVAAPVAAGQFSYGLDIGPWGALSLITDIPVDTADYSFLTFKIRAAQSDLPLQIGATGGFRPDRPFGSCMLGGSSYTNGAALAADTWVDVTVPLRDLGVDDQAAARFTIRNQSGNRSARFWIDDMYLVRADGTGAVIPTTTVTPTPETVPPTATATPAPSTATPTATPTPDAPTPTATATATATPTPTPTVASSPAAPPCGTVAGSPSYGTIRTIYQDALAEGWRNDSWSASADYASTTTGQSGTNAIEVDLRQWGAWSVSSNTAIETTDYRWIELFIKASEPNLPLAIRLNDASGQPRVVCELTATYVEQGAVGMNFTRVLVPLAALDLPTNALSRLSIIYRNGKAGPTVWIDNVRLVS